MSGFWKRLTAVFIVVSLAFNAIAFGFWLSLVDVTADRSASERIMALDPQTVILAITQVLLGALAIFGALFGIIGYQAIKDAAEKTARNVAEKATNDYLLERTRQQKEADTPPAERRRPEPSPGTAALPGSPRIEPEEAGT